MKERGIMNQFKIALLTLLVAGTVHGQARGRAIRPSPSPNTRPPPATPSPASRTRSASRSPRPRRSSPPPKTCWTASGRSSTSAPAWPATASPPRRRQRRSVTRFGTGSRRRFDPLAQLGGSLLQDHAIGPRGRLAARFLPRRPAGREHRRRPPHHAALRPRPGRRHARRRLHRPGRDAGRRGATDGGPRQHGRQPPRRQTTRRQVRLEGAGADAPPVLRRRVPERDGHHHARSSRTRTARKATAPSWRSIPAPASTTTATTCRPSPTS